MLDIMCLPAWYFHWKRQCLHSSHGGSCTSIACILAALGPTAYRLDDLIPSLPLPLPPTSCRTFRSRHSGDGSRGIVDVVEFLVAVVGWCSIGQTRNSKYPACEAVNSTTTGMTSPGRYRRSIIPDAYRPPSSWSRGSTMFHGSPHTPHLPPFTFHWAWTSHKCAVKKNWRMAYRPPVSN